MKNHSVSLQTTPFTYVAVGLCLVWSISVLVLDALTKTKDHSVELVPDFANIEHVGEKKSEFFKFFGLLVSEENARQLERRDVLEGNPSQQELEKLASLYRLEISSPASNKDVAELRARVDVLPASLVLSQAAIESAWGTSRFAREGFNYFGQWCFSKGCGIVPNARPEGASYEVRKFSSPKEAIQAYFVNLNSFDTYEGLRDIRLKARREGRSANGCELAAGLGKYSERGDHYIEEVRQIIRVNKLGGFDSEYCKKADRVQ